MSTAASPIDCKVTAIEKWCPFFVVCLNANFSSESVLADPYTDSAGGFTIIGTYRTRAAKLHPPYPLDLNVQYYALLRKFALRVCKKQKFLSQRASTHGTHIS